MPIRTTDTLRTPSRPILASLGLALCLLAASFALPAQTPAGVGIADFQATDPIGGGPIPGFVFYPASVATETGMIGPHRVAAAFDAPAQPGAKPLVVISHGQGGDRLGHHDLATFLARHGFIVATLTHPRDNFRDPGGAGHPEVLFGRPHQVSALVSALLADADWQALIDGDRIGVAGFSMGGYTSLLLVGGVPRFELFSGYCERRPEDRDTCGFIERLAAESGDGGQSVVEFTRSLDRQLRRWGDPSDPRIKAAFAMAPTSVVFDAEGAASIDRPVFLYHAEHDRHQPPAENELRIRPLIGSAVESGMVPGADHWVFLAPCPPEWIAEAVDVCTDPPGVDRVEAHARINADAVSFFRRTLDVPGH